MRYFFIVFFMISFSLFAQDEKPRFKRHFFEVAPIALTFKRQVNIHQHLEYRFLITPYLYLNAATTGTFIRKFDYSSTTLPGKRPIFNESSLVLGYQYAFNKLTETNRKSSFVGVDAGYHFMQYSIHPNYWDYDIVDSTAIGFRRLGGFLIHSLKAGLTYQHIIYSNHKDKPKIRFRHFLALSYLYGVDYQAPTFIVTSQVSAIKAENLTTGNWRNRNGYRFEYTFQHPIGDRVGLLHGVSAVWAPWVKHTPNKDYYVPRGGENHLPFAFNFRIGITF